MKTSLTLCILSFVSYLSCGAQQNQEVSSKQEVVPDSVAAIGIWEVPQDEKYIYGKTKKGGRWSSGPGFEIFNYDGTYVTLMLFTEKAWMWKEPDDHYKLNTKWSNDSLFYLPPFGRWQFLAVYKNEEFTITRIDETMNHTWRYKKIRREDVREFDQAVIKERKPHDYSIKPMDVFKE